MTQLAIDSQGTLLYVSSAEGSPATRIQVNGVTAIRDLRSGTAAEIDVSDLNSLAKEFRTGLKDEGSMTFDVIYLPADAGQKRLVAMRNSRELGDFELAIQTGSPFFSITWKGLVTQFPFSIGVDDVLRGSVTVRVSGSITEG